jgi:hypothetical protein
MNNELKIDDKELVLFENSKIRRIKYNEEWFYSIVDIMEILTESKNPSRYWNELYSKLNAESNELFGKIEKLKLIAKDGKSRPTDCANRETIFRIIQSVPSPNAEPFKLWFARLAEERIQETIDPSIAIARARQTYLDKGYTDDWINTRMKNISARNNLTDEWQKRGVTTKLEFAMLTDEISKSTFGIKTAKHKEIKNLNKDANLRDNMSPIELALTTLAEVTTTELHKTNDSQGYDELETDAHAGGNVASKARKNIEKLTGKTVITSEHAESFKKYKQESLDIK